MSRSLVRDARVEELPTLINLLKITDLFWEIGDCVETLSKKLEFDPSSILVLELEGNIIGMVTTTYDPWASFIWHLAIEPEYQGQGLGHLLADEAEKRLREHGTTSVNGYVLPNNKNSLSFLKKRGFKEFFSPVIAVEKTF